MLSDGVVFAEGPPLEVLKCDNVRHVFGVHGFAGVSAQGVLDFSLVGILAKLTGVLARNGIGLFAISTFNTDYVLVKEERFSEALDLLADEGYAIAK